MLLQTALTSQLCFPWAHSSISENSKRSQTERRNGIVTCLLALILSVLFVNRHSSMAVLDSLLNKIYWRKRRRASIHCCQLNELFFIQHSLHNKISFYIYTRDLDSPDLYNYLCTFFHLHKIHLCKCSYRIPGCCYTQH